MTGFSCGIGGGLLEEKSIRSIESEFGISLGDSFLTERDLNVCSSHSSALLGLVLLSGLKLN